MKIKCPLCGAYLEIIHDDFESVCLPDHMNIPLNVHCSASKQGYFLFSLEIIQDEEKTNGTKEIK
jgi:hypothetical protein